MGKIDKRQKLYFEDRRRFADIWNGTVFGGEQVIPWEELDEKNTVLTHTDDDIAGKARTGAENGATDGLTGTAGDGAAGDRRTGAEADVERTADLIMKRMRDGRELAILILENQTKMDYSMPARIFLEEALAYEKQVREIRARNEALYKKLKQAYRNVAEYLYHFTRKDRLRPVSTLVLYWGTEAWDGAESLHQLIDFSGVEEMRQLVPEFRIHVVDMSRMEHEDAFRTDLRALVALYKRRNSKEDFKEYLREHEGELDLAADGMSVLGQLVDSKELIQCASELVKSDEGGNTTMCRAITEWIEEEREAGRAEGMERGIEQGIERGIAEGKKKLIFQIQRKVKRGKTLAEMADDLEDTEDAIRPILEAIREKGVDCPPEEIYEYLNGKPC